MLGNLQSLCRCGHLRREHEHYRPGTDCALCRCRRFRRHRWWQRKIT